MRRFLIIAIAALPVLGSSGACAVERPNPSAEERVRDAELVVVVDGIEMLPKTSREFDKFYRVSARIAGVVKGGAAIGDRIEVVVDATIAEHRNDCCEPGRKYVTFLRKKGEHYQFVGSPLGTIPLQFEGGR